MFVMVQQQHLNRMCGGDGWSDPFCGHSKVEVEMGCINLLQAMLPQDLKVQEVLWAAAKWLTGDEVLSSMSWIQHQMWNSLWLSWITAQVLHSTWSVTGQNARTPVTSLMIILPNHVIFSLIKHLLLSSFFILPILKPSYFPPTITKKLRNNPLCFSYSWTALYLKWCPSW
jgi:hypothetical protein